MGDVIDGEFSSKELTTQEKYGVPTAKPVESVRAMNLRAKARLNFAIADLANGNSAKVSAWLDQVAERNPAEALKLYMELLEFTQPRLKAAPAQQDVPQATARLNDLSIEDLERIANGEG